MAQEECDVQVFRSEGLDEPSDLFAPSKRFSTFIQPFGEELIEGRKSRISMYWHQKKIRIGSRSRGFHLITQEVLRAVPEISELTTGMLHVFIKHTSASLTINENADASVRIDFERHMNEMVPEDQPYYTHTYEGSDDMPAHIKASLMGTSVQVPIRKGRVELGTWQGIYLCEHRDYGGSRELVVTAWGV